MGISNYNLVHRVNRGPTILKLWIGEEEGTEQSACYTFEAANLQL